MEHKKWNTRKLRYVTIVFSFSTYSTDIIIYFIISSITNRLSRQNNVRYIMLHRYIHLHQAASPRFGTKNYDDLVFKLNSTRHKFVEK